MTIFKVWSGMGEGRTLDAAKDDLLESEGNEQFFTDEITARAAYDSIKLKDTYSFYNAGMKFYNVFEKRLEKTTEAPDEYDDLSVAFYDTFYPADVIEIETSK